MNGQLPPSAKRKTHKYKCEGKRRHSQFNKNFHFHLSTLPYPHNPSNNLHVNLYFLSSRPPPLPRSSSFSQHHRHRCYHLQIADCFLSTHSSIPQKPVFKNGKLVISSLVIQDLDCSLAGPGRPPVHKRILNHGRPCAHLVCY